MTSINQAALMAKPTAKQVHAPAKEYRYPLRSGNDFELIIDGENYFPRLFEDIRNAQHNVFMEMYLSGSGEIFTQFIDAVLHARSNNVEVFLLFDDFGVGDVSDEDMNKLKSAGVNTAIYNPIRFFRFKKNLHRTHRKVIIVDGQLAWVGGTGLLDLFAPTASSDTYWLEVMVRIQGTCVDDWMNLFYRAWGRWAKKVPLPHLPPSQSHATNSVGRVVMNRSAKDCEIRNSLIQHMETSTEKIWLCAPYFVPTRKVRSLIRKAAKRGLDVRILLPGDTTDNAGARYMARRYYARFLRAGVKIFEFQPRFVHAKVLLVDDWSSIGSSNLDRWNLSWNLDANQEIHGGNFSEHTVNFFEDSFVQSKAFDLKSWKERPLGERFKEKFWGYIAALVVRFSRNAGKNKLI